jgi:hypothetical protein
MNRTDARRGSALSLPLALSLALSPAAAMDMSCNGLQHSQFMNQIDSSSVSPADRARFKEQADRFANDMDRIRRQAESIENRITTTYYAHAKEIADANPALVQSAADAVRRQRPDLLRRIAAGDDKANGEFNAAIYAKLVENRGVARALETRLFNDTSYLQDRAQDQRFQRDAHVVEKAQNIARAAVPLQPAAQELVERRLSDRYVEVTTSDRQKREALERAATDMPALRSLFAASGLASRIAKGDSSFTNLQSVSGRSQGVFDDPVVLSGLNAVGRVASQIAGTKLQAELDLGQTVRGYVPSDRQLRQEVMQNADLPLARSTAAHAADALHKFDQSQKGADELKVATDRLIKAIPPTPEIAAPSQPGEGIREWMTKAGKELGDAAEKVTRYVDD